MNRRLIRPLWVVGITWAAVCLVGAWLPVTVLCVATAGCLLCAVLALCIPRLRRWHGMVLCLLTVVAAACVLLYWQTARYLPTREWEGREVDVCVEVQDNEALTELKVLSGELPEGTRLQLWWEPLGAALDPGDVVTASFEVYVTEHEGLPMLWDRADGMWLAVMPTDLSGEAWKIVESDLKDTSFLPSLRRELVISIQKILPGDVGAVVTGICLGADERLSYAAAADFRACGVSHLFAVSGLHLSVLTQALLWLLKRLHLPRRLRGVICAVAVLIFLLLAGGTPSVIRAGVLCLVVILGDCVRRQADARNSLGAALLLLLAADPFAVYDVGLLLSFSATFGLLFLSSKIKQVLLNIPMNAKLTAVWERMVGAAAVTLSATLVTLPVMILYFGEVSLIGIAANLLMTLPAALLLIVGWIVIVTLSLGLSFVYYPLLMLLGGVARLLIWVATGLASLPFATATIVDTYLVIGVLGGLAVIGIGWLLLRRHGVRLAAVLCAVVLCVGVGVYQYRMRDTVRFLVIPEQSDLAVCLLYRRQAILVTAPTKANTLYATREALQRAGITSLDAVILPRGEWDGVPYVPHVLRDYLGSAAVYRGIDGMVALSEDTHILLRGSWLWVRCGAVEAAFDLEDTAASLTDAADVAFCTGMMMETAEEAVTVVQNALPSYTVPPHGIVVPRDKDVWIWINDSGELSIK